MTPEASIGGLQVLDLVAAVAAIGVDTECICRKVGLDAVRGGDGERVPASRVLALLDAADLQSKHRPVGLRAGERAEPRGPLAYLLLASAGLEEGLRQVARFGGITISTLHAEVEATHDRLSLVYQLGDETLALHRHLIDYVLMANLRSLWRAAGGRFALREVQFRFADPGDDAEAIAFGCPVRFGQADTRWSVDASELRRAPPLANPLVAAQIESFAGALLAQLPANATLRTRVADATRKLLANGVRADRAGIARLLGMSDRTLQRGLEDEQTTFKQVRDAVLWEVVEALLSDPALKIEAIALSTGFGDLAAFSKAFKRWAGCTPTEHRQRIVSRISGAAA